MISNGVILNDRYTVDSVIGEGGGGVVYKAYDRNLQSHVVVKQIKEDVSSLLECRTEVDILKQLKHENLPKVLDFFEADQKIYTVMDYIEGLSLFQALKMQGRYLQKDVLDWTRQLARALAYLHRQSPPIIHSDIKPANIMLNPATGKLCLIDFNISLAISRDKRSITWISGGYSPPEQYKSMKEYIHYLASIGKCITQERRQAQLNEIMGSGIDERSDVYSLGAALYHLLTGVRPEADFLDIVPISQYDMDLSEGFAHIIEKCMEIDPEKRYQNGIELHHAIENIYELDSEYKSYKGRLLRKKMTCLFLVFGGALLTVGGLVTRGREKVSEYQQLVQEAERSIADLEFEEAVPLLTRAQAILPARIDAVFLEALRLYKTNDYAACIQAALLALNQEQYQIKTEKDREYLGNLYYVLGNAYLEEAQYQDANSCFEKALETVETNNLYFRDYAISLARSGQADKALKMLAQAEESKLDQDSITFVKGEISFAQKDYFTAQSTLQSVIENTNDLELWERSVLLLYRMYKQCGPDYQNTAIELLKSEKARNGEEGNINLSEALADAYMEKARTHPEEKAIYLVEALNEYISIYNSGYTTIRMMDNIGILYRELGQIDAAGKMADQMLNRYPEDYRGYKLRAFLELDKQQKQVNEQRNYKNFQSSYQDAAERYEKQSEQTDQEMQQLKQMYQDLSQGGWY